MIAITTRSSTIVNPCLLTIRHFSIQRDRKTVRMSASTCRTGYQGRDTSLMLAVQQEVRLYGADRVQVFHLSSLERPSTDRSRFGRSRGDFRALKSRVERHHTKTDSTADPASKNFSGLFRVFGSMNNPAPVGKDANPIRIHGKSDQEWRLDDLPRFPKSLG